MPYATRSKGPAAQEYMTDSDGTLVVISPSANGQGTHMKWIRNDSAATPTTKKRQAASTPLSNLNTIFTPPSTPPPTTPSEDGPRTPKQTSLVGGSVARTPKAQRLVRSPVMIKNTSTWSSPDAAGGVDELIRRSEERGGGRLRMMREAENIRNAVARRRAEEEDRIHDEQLRKLCAERDRRMEQLRLEEEEDRLLEEAEGMDFEESESEPDVDIKTVDHDVGLTWFPSFSEAASTSAATELLDTSSFTSFGVPGPSCLSRCPTEIINLPPSRWPSIGKPASSSPFQDNFGASNVPVPSRNAMLRVPKVLVQQPTLIFEDQ